MEFPLASIEHGKGPRGGGIGQGLVHQMENDLGPRLRERILLEMQLDHVRDTLDLQSELWIDVDCERAYYVVRLGRIEPFEGLLAGKLLVVCNVSRN
jgi:hypothetical protein